MKAGFLCYNVIPLPMKCYSTLFTTRYKRFTEGGHGAFGPLAFGLWGFWFFDVGDFGREKDY
jgi:hypothetical protein